MDIEVYHLVKKNIKTLLDINLDHYKDEQMRRRLDSWLVRTGSANWNEYFKRLRSDSQELLRFRNYLTINVSAFFRDPERWQTLRQTILPELLKEALRLRPQSPGLRAWSAGCSIGAEPYSLAILLDELSPSRCHTILATDLDLGALAKAKDGGPYTADEIENLTPSQRTAYLMPGGPPFYLKESLRKKVEFRAHNLLSDAYESNLDLIICRNVVIYFTAETKDSLYRKFHAALRPGGILFVGATEIISQPQQIGFRGHGISFYQKI
jgi:chemotaxis protein methyltransferase CheR